MLDVVAHGDEVAHRWRRVAHRYGVPTYRMSCNLCTMLNYADARKPERRNKKVQIESNEANKWPPTAAPRAANLSSLPRQRGTKITHAQ